VPGRKLALSADKEMTLDRWKKALLDLMPHKPVQEMMRGWLEKKGDEGTGGGKTWKQRFFVLLSTRELLYFEKEDSTKRKGTIDLKTAQAINLLPEDYYNYEDAFEILTGKRHWVLCPNSKKDQQAWLAALRPMIAEEGSDEAKEGGQRGSVIGSFGRAGSVVAASPDAPSRPKRISVSAATRTSRISMSMMVESSVVHKGWLDRREGDGDDATWQRRFFELTAEKRDGKVELSLEYFLDDAKTEDEDSDTMVLGPQASVTVSKEAGKPHALTLTAQDGSSQVLAASSEAELSAWVAVLDKGKGAPVGLMSEASSISETKSRGTSVESQVTVTKPTGERVHAGTMAKKGEGMMAKWQQRWFVLFGSGQLPGQLQYFSSESEDEASLKGTISLAGVKPSDVVRLKPGSSDYSFAIQTAKRKWVLNPGTGATYDEWHAKIMTVLG